MPEPFTQSALLVREQVALFRAANVYDIVEPATGAPVATAREQFDNPLLKLLKFTNLRRRLPFTIEIFDPIGQKLLSLGRPFTFWHSRVTVYDAYRQPIGRFQQRWGLGGKFDVYDGTGQPIGHLLGEWKSWSYQFVDRFGQPLATITKKWAGLRKELITNGTNYVVEMTPGLTDPTQRQVAVAAVICIDMVLRGR